MRVLDYRNKRHMQFLGKKWWLLNDFLKIGMKYMYIKKNILVFIYIYIAIFNYILFK